MYPYTSIQVTETAPVTEPVGLADVKGWLEIDYNDKDFMLAHMLTGARQTVEARLNLHLVGKTVVVDVETTCADILPLPYAKTVTGLVVKELNDKDEEETLESGKDYFLRGNGLRIPTAGRYTIAYTTAPGDVPQDIKEAIMMEVAERFANRGENSGELSKSALHKIQPHVVQWL